jgi:hypothetical protein
MQIGSVLTGVGANIITAVSDNMAKVLGAFDDTHDDPELLVSLSASA